MCGFKRRKIFAHKHSCTANVQEKKCTHLMQSPHQRSFLRVQRWPAKRWKEVKLMKTTKSMITCRHDHHCYNNCPVPLSDVCHRPQCQHSPGSSWWSWHQGSHCHRGQRASKQQRNASWRKKVHGMFVVSARSQHIRVLLLLLFWIQYRNPCHSLPYMIYLSL